MQKAMCFLRNNNGEIIHDNNSIRHEAKLYYEKLHRSQEEDIFDIDNMLEKPTLSKEESDSLEGNLTLQETLSVLKHMKNDKSPGSDGYIVEFFKFFLMIWGNFWSDHLIMDLVKVRCW